MDVEVAPQVVIGKVRGELEEVLLLADLVCFLFMFGMAKQSDPFLAPGNDLKYIQHFHKDWKQAEPK
jgi:hypothetical protein